MPTPPSPRRLTPEGARALFAEVEAHNDWTAIRAGTRAQLAAPIVAEAERLLAGPWPPRD
ncbi:hypothetical protein ACFV5J_27610 [Streptomyces zaomyceticus]|uniref:hypothetical protein n=1 Tax=Streptomyces zaomyceticus TaxID=68286 RepID=UPI00366636F6